MTAARREEMRPWAARTTRWARVALISSADWKVGATSPKRSAERSARSAAESAALVAGAACLKQRPVAGSWTGRRQRPLARLRRRHRAVPRGTGADLGVAGVSLCSGFILVLRLKLEVCTEVHPHV